MENEKWERKSNTEKKTPNDWEKCIYEIKKREREAEISTRDDRREITEDRGCVCLSAASTTLGGVQPL